jgi:RimJ/RimL family protein N-acetyltransferase
MTDPDQRTPRVRIVQLDAPTLAALADGDLTRARQTATAPLSAWLAGPDCVGTWRYRARQAVESPQDLPWMTGVLTDERTGQAVGKAGFHGAPDEAGMVEVGYAVDPAFRRRGYARAALEAMIARARREPDVRTLRASVSPDNGASLALIASYAFAEVGEQWDDEDGLETVYEMSVT